MAVMAMKLEGSGSFTFLSVNLVVVRLETSKADRPSRRQAHQNQARRAVRKEATSSAPVLVAKGAGIKSSAFALVVDVVAAFSRPFLPLFPSFLSPIT